jgi:hypothetical protein
VLHYPEIVVQQQRFDQIGIGAQRVATGDILRAVRTAPDDDGDLLELWMGFDLY